MKFFQVNKYVKSDCTSGILKNILFWYIYAERNLIHKYDSLSIHTRFYLWFFLKQTNFFVCFPSDVRFDKFPLNFIVN